MTRGITAATALKTLHSRRALKCNHRDATNLDYLFSNGANPQLQPVLCIVELCISIKPRGSRYCSALRDAFLEYLEAASSAKLIQEG